MATALVGLGSNVGDRRATLNRAVELLQAHEGIFVLACSQWLATAPVGGPAGQGEFLNGAMKVETSLKPAALHQVLHEVERQLGRTRGVRWDERILDLDLLLYDSVEIESPQLTIPHPSMAFRRFVLVPAAEVAPEMRHPILKCTIRHLLDHLKTAAPYAAVTGLDFQVNARLAARLTDRFDRSLISDPCALEVAALLKSDSASRDFERQVEFLGRRAEVLAAAMRDSWDRWLVSGFWIYDFWEPAEKDLTNLPAWVCDLDFQTSWSTGIAYQRPKLLIVPETDLDFIAHVRAAGIPSLNLKSADPEQQFAEADAALEAMS